MDWANQMDWFLYDRDLRQERVKWIVLRLAFITYYPVHISIYFILFLSSGISHAMKHCAVNRNTSARFVAASKKRRKG